MTSRFRMGLRRQTLVLFLLAIVLAVALYFLFGVFLDDADTPPYARDIAAAFMGALVTVVITMVLLNRQSEAEVAKERDVELLKQKIAVYNDLTDQLRSVMVKGKVDLEDEIAIQILNQKLSFYASADVLGKFNEFARQFSLVAADRKVSDDERTQLLGVLGELSLTIRADLASEEDLRRERARFSDEELKRRVMSNVNSLTSTTTVDQFLEACNAEERDYFSRLFAALDAAGIAYQMGTKGFSASRVFRGYPTFGSRLHGMHLRMDQVPEDKRDQVREMVAKATGRTAASLTGEHAITFAVTELPVEAVCEVIGAASGSGAEADGAAED